MTYVRAALLITIGLAVGAVAGIAVGLQWAPEIGTQWSRAAAKWRRPYDHRSRGLQAPRRMDVR
jgi:hypothetical protein